MVRLEKVLYEQVLNIKALGRARTIATPQKWYNENRHDAYKVAAYRVCHTGITGAIFRAFEPFFSNVFWKWARDIAGQRGFAMEDFLLHQDRELRRCYFFETVSRQSMHPYQWLFFKRRRARYYKVERGLRGFWVPEWAKKEGDARLMADTLENKEVWENFIYKEYMSDQTPSGRWSILSKWNPLIMFNPHGLWRFEAWDRYFYNEVFYESTNQQELQQITSNPLNINLQTDEGKRRFEQEVKRFISLYPGTIVKDGEQFNFERFYAREALLNKRDTSRFDSALVSQVKAELAESAQQNQIDGPSGAKKVAARLPDFMRPQFGKGLF